ncbi:MAG TPA: NAD(P)/FAD-dependent oxidoreductase [Planctomycetota bacterium]
MSETADVVVVGAGAAGLATAIFTARLKPGLRVVVLDGAAKVGAKILVSGGGRCNVTHEAVEAADFWGGSPNVVRRILAALPVDRTIAFFREIGVTLHVEDRGKLFPDSNSARTVLDALLAEAARLGVELRAACRVTAVARRDDLFQLATSGGDVSARKVVLATGGLSLPKTGSDGLGYQLATSLGHTLVATTPALEPLQLEGDFHVALSGVALPVEIAVRAAGRKPAVLEGPMLWTHFGISGPAALDASRHWRRAKLENAAVTVTANLLPGHDFAALEAKLLQLVQAQPRTHLRNVLSTLLPAKVVDALLARLRVRGDVSMANVSREDRRTLVKALLEWPLPVAEGRGYNFAEVTAGGVPLAEVDPSTLESRRGPGLYFTGEILDVDGRLGGFNFQWAWSSAWVVASALARA